MSRSDQSAGQISTYRFPDEVRVDELLLRGPVDNVRQADVPLEHTPIVGERDRLGDDPGLVEHRHRTPIVSLMNKQTVSETHHI